MDIISLIFPKKCITCGKGEKYLCEVCVAKVQIVDAICAYCQKPSIDGMTHASCLTKSRMDGFISFWDYAGVIRRGILALKYKFAREISNELVDLVVDNLNQKYSFLGENWTLVPVPIHHSRENWRGFNQSALIGGQIARKMNWIFKSDVLVKAQKTTAQADLKGKERVKNIRGVFALNPKYKLKQTSIILFDDVFTTGSTIKEAAKVLKRGGAGRMRGLTIAR